MDSPDERSVRYEKIEFLGEGQVIICDDKSSDVKIMINATQFNYLN
jgi:hypothetical protein